MHEVTQLSICYQFVLMVHGELKLMSPKYFDLGLIQPTLDEFRVNHDYQVTNHDIVVRLIKYEFREGVIYSVQNSRVDIYDGLTKLESIVLDPVTEVIIAHPTYEQYLDYSTRNEYYSVYNGRYYDAIPVPHVHISREDYSKVCSYTFNAEFSDLPSAEAIEQDSYHCSSDEFESLSDTSDDIPSGIKSEIYVQPNYQPVKLITKQDQVDLVRVPVIQPKWMNKRQRRRFRAKLRQQLQSASADKKPKLKTYSAHRSTVVFEPSEHILQIRSGTLYIKLIEIYIKQPSVVLDLVRSRRLENLLNSRERYRISPTGNTKAMSMLS